MQFLDRMRSLLAGWLSRLAESLNKQDKKIPAITYSFPEEENTEEKQETEEENEPLKVISCTVKTVKVKKKDEN